MGLDMYLNKRTYVQQWEHQKPEHKYEVVVTKGGEPTNIKPNKVKYIIHNHIIKNPKNRLNKGNVFYFVIGQYKTHLNA